jgi:hypothetical protein
MFIFQKNKLPQNENSARMLKNIIGKVWRKMTPSLRRKIVLLTQNQFTVSVAAIVVNESGEVLLLDHVLRPASGWGIPGRFSRPQRTACRSLAARTARRNRHRIKHDKTSECTNRHSHIEILFRAEGKGTAEVKTREINSLGWFDIDKMPENMDRRQKSMIRNYLKDKVDG